MNGFLKTFLPSKYFVFGSVCFWLAVHAIYALIKFRAIEGTERGQSWLEIWWLISPWFFIWIGLTLLIHTHSRIFANLSFSVMSTIAVHLVTMLILLTLYWLFSSFFFLLLTAQPLNGFWAFFYKQVMNTFHVDILIYLTVLSASTGMIFYDIHIRENMEVKRLQNALIHEQLKTLRTQLNPHFLFNALNTVASLVRLKREKQAIQALSDLSFMLRKVLENKNNRDVKIRDEVAFIKRYLAIQHMRFADKLDVQLQIDENCMDIEIPSMLLQPLVENAVQHGSQLESNMNVIRLTISKGSHQLNIKLTNKVAANDTHKGFGVGLTNTHERLMKIYANFTLTANPLPGELFETIVAIPLGGEGA
jgi:sensor histidine kinase YesM